jgi:hypothetical protein
MAAERTHPSQRRYPPELRERAVRLVAETIDQTGTRRGGYGAAWRDFRRASSWRDFAICFRAGPGRRWRRPGRAAKQ